MKKQKHKKHETNNTHKQTLKKVILILVGSALLAGGVWYKDWTEMKQSLGLVFREAEGGNTQKQTFNFSIYEGESTQELEISVAPVVREEEAIYALLLEALEEWEAVFLGENSSVNEVRSNLYLPDSACEGEVSITHASSDPSVLKKDGTVQTEGLTEEGVLVELTAQFTCDGYTQIETRTLSVLPPKEGSSAWILQSLQQAVEQLEASSREQSVFALPQTIEGYTVIWQEKKSYRWVVVLVLGIVAAVCIQQQELQNRRKQEKIRKEQLLREYPHMIDQFCVLVNAGMPIRRAWERMLYAEQGNRQHSLYVEEMWITYREIRQGRGEREAYERFGHRIGLMPYKKFSSILTQNLSKGTRNMQELLKAESAQAMDMRRMRAKKLGEEAGTKLLFPMLVMLMLILLVLLLPAMADFSM